MTRRTTVIYSLLLLSVFGRTNAFAPSQQSVRPTTELQFGIPTFGPKDDDKSKKDPNIEDKKIGLAGLVQLVTAGLGAPFLGDYQGVDKARRKRDRVHQMQNMIWMDIFF